MSEHQEELLRLNQQLLESIASADWSTYETLCDATLTCFEPEANGQLVDGMAFHRHYFNHPAERIPTTTMASPHVRVMGDCAIVSYTRLIQIVDSDGGHSTASFNETRVWQRQNGQWRHVHFHRSPA